MADDNKKDVIAGKETEGEASAKVAKAAKKSPSKPKKTGPSVGEKIKKYFKDVKGEAKKIVWPDAKTVFKSTGVVLLVVIICALIIWGIDTGLSAGVSGLKSLAQGTTETSEVVTDENGETVTAAESAEEDADGEEKTEEASEESTTEAAAEEASEEPTSVDG